MTSFIVGEYCPGKHQRRRKLAVAQTLGAPEELNVPAVYLQDIAS
jgi:hypothetical protein